MPPRGGPHRRRLAATVASLAVFAILAGCGAASPTQTNAPTVVASFYPWAWLSRQIAGGTASVRNLTGPGTEPHDLELTARQIVDVRRARLIVYVKGMQPAVDDAVEHAEGHALDAGSVADGLSTGPGGDPHIWLDPVRFTAVAKEIGDRLARLDPANAEKYLQRTERLVRTLGELDEAYRSGLRTCQSRTLVTSHASFGYLADRYGLEQVGIARQDPHVPPSPARLAEVARLIEAEDVEVIFLGRLASPDAATSLAREVGARTAVLDPVEGVRPGSSEDYLSLMRGNLATLREALGCT